MDYLEQSRVNILKAKTVLRESGIVDICDAAGCEVNLVGSVRMGLLANHRDIDLHIYSKDITEEESFAMMAEVAKKENVISLSCENGLKTDERCISWHVLYRVAEGDIWKFDIIHIEKGSRYDGFFERMADRIIERLDDETRETILRLKFSTPQEEIIHGVEYYRAVLEDNVSTLDELRLWLKNNRSKMNTEEYWMP